MVTSDGLLPGAPVVGAGLEHAVTVQAPAYTPADDSLSAVHDPGLGLDAGVSTATSVVSTVVTDGDGLVASTGIDAGATLDVTSNVVTDVAGSVGLSDVVDLDVAHLDPAVSSVVGTVGTVTGSDVLDGVTADPVGGALDTVGNVTGTATGLVDGLGHRSEQESDTDHHGAVTDLLF
jgi:hypothetical protein